MYTAIEHDDSLMQTLVDLFNGTKDFADVNNGREYYFNLEFKNHLKKSEVNSFSDKIEYSKAFEDKFLSEVYEMQGRHKNFENFSNELVIHFSSEQNIQVYL